MAISAKLQSIGLKTNILKSYLIFSRIGSFMSIVSRCYFPVINIKTPESTETFETLTTEVSIEAQKEDIQSQMTFYFSRIDFVFQTSLYEKN